MKCVDLMIKHNIKGLPVLDDAGNVIGMIYAQDVFDVIKDVILAESPGGEN
jgi:CBS domain-containing protein